MRVQSSVVSVVPSLEKLLATQTVGLPPENRPMPPEIRRPSSGRQSKLKRGSQMSMPSSVRSLLKP